MGQSTSNCIDVNLDMLVDGKIKSMLDVIQYQHLRITA